MATILPQERELAPISRIQRIAGRPDDPYEVIFLDREGRIIVPLTEWYRLEWVNDRGVPIRYMAQDIR